MLRRLVAVPALALVALLLSPAVAGAYAGRPPGDAAHGSTALSTVRYQRGADGPTTLRPEQPVHVAAASTTTTEALPGTTLEAEERNDGTSPAPWLIGSGIAAIAVVAIGGSILKRRAG